MQRQLPTEGLLKLREETEKIRERKLKPLPNHSAPSNWFGTGKEKRKLYEEEYESSRPC